MATIAEQLTSLANTKAAIKQSIIDKGVEVLDTDTFASYADKITQIQGGGGSASKFGMTIDNVFGTPNESGVLNLPAEGFDFIGTGIKSISEQVMRYALPYKLVQTFYMPDLEAVGRYGLNYACIGDTSLQIVDMRKLKKVDGYGCYYAFNACTGLIKANTDSLYEVSSTNGLGNMFYGCAGLTKYYFPSLMVLGAAGALGNSSTGIFNRCTGITELHFLAQAQNSIEAQSAYSTKFGATNATIYFDLMWQMQATNGMLYERSEPDSLYDGWNKTFVAWKSYDDGSIAYTVAGTEPAEGTPVYSDAGITQMGTVEVAL